MDIFYKLEKSDSNMYLSVVFSSKENWKSATFFYLCVVWPRSCCVPKPWSKIYLLDTFDIYFWPLEKHFVSLWTRRVQLKWTKSHFKSRHFEMDFWKKFLKCVFLTSKVIYASYDRWSWCVLEPSSKAFKNFSRGQSDMFKVA